MKISILTLFPKMFAGVFTHSILKRAQEKQKVTIELINIRDFGTGTHKMVDDTPYGGGIGMVLKVDILYQAIEYAKLTYEKEKNGLTEKTKQRVILMSASGKLFKQAIASKYATIDHLIIICGHYEGVDARICEYIDEEISIGDFVLTGGEIPAMLITDSVVRLIDGVITPGATEDESFSEKNNALLEYPHYTKPRSFQGYEVPEILLSGNHQKIAAWRQDQSIKKTQKVRPDLLKSLKN
jgi:tRNA (guanine37-N1)-methyltransferase